jgi:putative SOS response-associated peptidase YedK
MRLLTEQFLFDLEPDHSWPLRYNIAPTQEIAAVRADGERGCRTLVSLRWGLIPSWAKDPSIGNRMINARAETVAEKPSFRNAMKRRRCLVLSDGYYEWQKKQGPKGPKQPFYFCLNDERPFAFAGLWESWKDPSGSRLESCTIITTEANTLTRPIHDRMPVILPADSYDHWLDPTLHDAAELQPLLRSYPSEEMKAFPVSTLVNSPRNDDPACTVQQS